MLMSSVCQRLLGEPCLLRLLLRKTTPLMLAVACTNVMVDVSLWLAEMLSFIHTSLTQNQTLKERLLKKYRLCRTFQNGKCVWIMLVFSYVLLELLPCSLWLLLLLAKAVFISSTLCKLLWTLFASSLSPFCTFPDFLLWQPSSIMIILTLNSLQTAQSRANYQFLVSCQFSADFTILIGILKNNKTTHLKYYQNNTRQHLAVAWVQLLGPVCLGLILLRGSVSRQSQLCTDPRYWSSPMWSC